MNPLPRTTPTQQGASGGTTIIVGGGSGIPFHQHPAEAIVSGTLDDDRLPERIGPIPVGSTDCDQEVESGWWAAGSGTANTPDVSSWVGQTIRFTEQTLGFFSVQTIYEVVGQYRIYQRTLNIFYTAWEQIDRDFLDTRYRLMTDDVSLTTEVSGILPIANGGTGTATPTKVLSGTTTVNLVAASSGFNTVTFSSAFAAAPVVTVTTENADYFGATAVRTTADARIYVSHRNTTNATISVVACWTAVGT